jgi:hypothetical protein
MPLIDLTTNLRDLKFGRDRVDGGSSNQPYVQSDIPALDKEPEGLGYLSQDFVVRGGLKAVTNSVKDVERLSKYFSDIRNPSGLLFIAKQNLLSRLSVKTQTSDLILNDGIYSSLSTLATAGGSAVLGLHTDKQIRLSDKYESKVKESKVKDNVEWKNNSRLFQLQNSIVNNKNDYTLGGIGIGDSKIGGIKLNPDPSILLKYGGGPESPLGIGNTNIRFASERTSNALPAFGHTTLKPSGIPNDFNTDIVKQVSNPSIMDFRNRINYSDSTKNIEGRLNLGSPGNKAGISTERDAGLAYSSTSYDKINASPLYQSDTVNDLLFPTTDIIPFRIGVIDNDVPSKKTYIHFRAFLDNISDSYSAEWKKQNYIGRGEDLYTYGGFDRKVSLSWTVVAQSKKELIPMYKKLNYLASVVMPDYSLSGYMRGNMVTLTVGGYFNEQPGIITGFSFDMNDDSATWEIGIDENGNEDANTSQLPHLIKVKGFNFIPIHNFVPRLQKNIFGIAKIDPSTNLPKVTPDDNGVDVEYGKEHFIALTTNTLLNENQYTIDDLGETIAQAQAALTSAQRFTTVNLNNDDLTPPLPGP